jgi:DNA-directed RNA polymerase I subunit RPA2
MEDARRVPTFNTLAREQSFKYPPKKGSTYPILNEFVAPHVESFNSLFDDSGLPSVSGDGRGLLSIALANIGQRMVFDGRGRTDADGNVDGWGNRMSCQ